jgi:membrane protein
VHQSDRSERGRQADSPASIPGPGWKDVLWRTFKEVGDDRVTLIAAGATYFLLLSLFPTVSAIVSVYGLFSDPAEARQHVAALAGVVPAGGLAIIDEQLQRITSQPSDRLGWALIVSIAVALWGASSGVKTMFEAMNVAYDEREKRNFFVLNAVALLFTLGGVVAAPIMLTIVVGIPVALEALGLGRGIGWLLWIGGYAVLALALIFGLAVLYRFGPSRRQAKLRWITPGALLATVIIGILSAGFSWYAASFAKYDETYGSLGGLIGFLFWVWVSMIAVVVGAELNSELERQTARDSTVGANAPMGTRDATVADTLGEPADRAFKGEDRVEPTIVRSRPGPRRSPLPLRYALPALVGLMFLERRQSQHR